MIGKKKEENKVFIKCLLYENFLNEVGSLHWWMVPDCDSSPDVIKYSGGTSITFLKNCPKKGRLLFGYHRESSAMNKTSTHQRRHPVKSDFHLKSRKTSNCV